MSGPPEFSADTEAMTPVSIDHATWHPLAGGAAERKGHVRLDSDDVLVLWADGQDLPIHATWHDVELEMGPYAISGALPTIPGFDPGRALARPGGPFVLLRDVRVTLVGNPEGGRVERPHALVNRYVVDRVVAAIDLGYYFPGAIFATPAAAGRA
ncbi:MAG: hypothetical protein HYX54_08345 [Chloroflexi bacterium]|nr:hypothetical protein [Chloroflexota bacterium]